MTDTTPHPHAASMLLYAQDAAKTDKPWERWEFTGSDDGFNGCLKHPEWREDFKYRRKPKTITVNGIRVPEPAREVPKMTDDTPPEALRLANVCSNLTRYSMDAHLIAAELRRQHNRIAELEAQLEAVGAGGVGSKVVGIYRLEIDPETMEAKATFMEAV